MGTYKKEFWSAADVRCPFYISDERGGRSISCEGYSEGASVMSRFDTIRGKQQHMGSFCVGKYERCPMYKCTYGAKYDD